MSSSTADMAFEQNLNEALHMLVEMGFEAQKFGSKKAGTQVKVDVQFEKASSTNDGYKVHREKHWKVMMERLVESKSFHC